MTGSALAKANRQKLAIAGAGAALIGLSALLSPLIPIAAIVVAAIATVVVGTRDMPG